MKRNIIIVEVGVRILEGQHDFESHARQIGVSLYDENVVCFFDKDLHFAKTYAKDYVEKGVPQTYAIVYSGGQVNLSKEQIDEIINNGYYDDCDSPSMEDIIDTYYKEKNEVTKLL